MGEAAGGESFAEMADGWLVAEEGGEHKDSV
jgi:hypothetical protein